MTRSKTTLGDVARAAGVSKSTACNVLRNRPGPSKATKDKVLRLAERMGYMPDAGVVDVMVKLRRAQTREALPIAWLNTNVEQHAWQQFKFLTPYFEGASRRCQQMGYRLEEIWMREPSMTMRRLAKILYHRGIEGIVVPQPARHVRLDWNYLAGVSLEGALLAPRLHRVMTDHFFNFHLALKVLRRGGYRRIGIFLSEQADSYSNHSFRSTASYFQSELPKADRVPPLFYGTTLFGRHDDKESTQARKYIKAWIHRYRPEVIVGHDNHMLSWVEEAGLRVPDEIGIVHLSTDDDVSDWAGINSHKREIGRIAVEAVIALIQNRQFGVSPIAMNTVVRGTWQPGRTLILPKP